MSVFNGSQTVEAAIESILQQQFCEFVFIIVDDASTDATPGILARYAQADSRIRVITNPINQERCVSRNMAIQAADAEYVAIMDADDIALPHRFARQVAFLDAHPDVDVCGSFIELFGTQSGVSTYPVEHDSIIACFLFSNPMVHSTVMARRELFEVAWYDPAFRLAEDFDLFSRMALVHGGRFHNLPEILVRYRTHPGDFLRPWHVKVAERNLKVVGIIPSCREMELHAALVFDPPHRQASLFSVREVYAWFDRLTVDLSDCVCIHRQSLSKLLGRFCVDFARHSSVRENLVVLQGVRFLDGAGYGVYWRLVISIAKKMVSVLLRR